MPNIVWTGAADDDVTNTGNWQGGSVPADGDTIFLTDQARRDLSTNLQAAAWQAKTVSVVAERGFTRKVGSNGNAFTLGGIDRLIWCASSQQQSYFSVDDGASAGGSNAIAVAICEANSEKENVLVLDSDGDGTINRVVCRSGSMQIASGATIDERISVSGGKLDIPSGVTLTGVEAKITDGIWNLASSIPTLAVDGGKFVLDGAAGISAYLEMNGGLFHWQGEGSSGAHATIALSELFGGVFKTINEREYRTMTAVNMYGDSVLDLSQGGLLMTLPNHGDTPPAGIRVFGRNRPIMPVGAGYSFLV